MKFRTINRILRIAQLLAMLAVCYIMAKAMVRLFTLIPS
jgi:hypothetical protein